MVHMDKDKYFDKHIHTLKKKQDLKLDRLKIKEKGKCVLNTISEAKENSILLIYLNIPMNNH